MSQFDTAYGAIVAHEPPHPAGPAEALWRICRLSKCRRREPRVDDTFAVLFSGDGGWAGSIVTWRMSLASRGIPVAGWDSLRYFWTARTPSGVAEWISTASCGLRATLA